MEGMLKLSFHSTLPPCGRRWHYECRFQFPFLLVTDNGWNGPVIHTNTHEDRLRRFLAVFSSLLSGLCKENKQNILCLCRYVPVVCLKMGFLWLLWPYTCAYPLTLLSLLQSNKTEPEEAEAQYKILLKIMESKFFSTSTERLVFKTYVIVGYWIDGKMCSDGSITGWMQRQKASM